ncbi:hypothetical protein E4U30_006538 [Claviceps sp. LM220 group G6]|nr:hypothetical protein E4U30_006538 [Claviceps sp. LM220 group G6]KAG6104684.1 hypothetical protein E4U31_001849 [Claviceps sp. LM219 group G6]
MNMRESNLYRTQLSAATRIRRGHTDLPFTEARFVQQHASACISDASSSIPSSSSYSVPPSPKWCKYSEPKNLLKMDIATCHHMLTLSPVWETKETSNRSLCRSKIFNQADRFAISDDQFVISAEA